MSGVVALGSLGLAGSAGIAWDGSGNVRFYLSGGNAIGAAATSSIVEVGYSPSGTLSNIDASTVEPVGNTRSLNTATLTVAAGPVGGSATFHTTPAAKENVLTITSGSGGIGPGLGGVALSFPHTIATRKINVGNAVNKFANSQLDRCKTSAAQRCQ